MPWKIENGPAIETERHFENRLVKCFAERPKSLDQLLSDAVRRNGDGDAIVDGDVRISYDTLDDIVDRIAAHLEVLGVAKGDRVALLLGNSAEFIYLILAAARIGAITVPINVREQAPEIAYILDHAGAKVLVLDESVSSRLPDLSRIEHRFAVGGGIDGDVASPFDELLSEKTAPSPAQAGEEDEEDIAVILYTSGTTGRPKGAMLTNFNIVHSVMHYELCMDLTAAERSVLAVPASHVTGLIANILTMVRVAGCNLILRQFETAAFLDLAARENMTHTLMVPAMYNLCLLRADFENYALSSWRTGGYGGAPMPEATIAALAERLPNLGLINAYGSTETTSPSTLMPLGETARRPDSIGIPVPCADIRIVDSKGQDVAYDQAGEIWIAGPMVVPGYWNDPLKTAAGFEGGYWKSGDIGSMAADGFVRILDRINDVINRGGYNIYSAEFENVLSHHPDIIECAAVAHPDEILGEKIHLFVRTKTDDLAAEALCRFCAEHLADYKLPDFVTFLEEPLPRNANGKVLKAELRGLLIAQ
ncbi:MAG: class I adenylate-forming enzyme family protein [Geminicoccaceae bacterium]